MDCEEAIELISADIGDGLDDDRRAAVDAHVSACESCCAADQAMRWQDAELTRAFAPRRRAASMVADRVTRELFRTEASRASPWRWGAMFLATAAGFVLAMISFQPLREHFAPSVAMTTPEMPSSSTEDVGHDSAAARRAEHLCAKLAESDAPNAYEPEIRALGDASVPALEHLLQSLDPQTEGGKRDRVAHMLADLAGPSRIPALIDLLGDETVVVRSCAQQALVRLTGRGRDSEFQGPNPGPVTATACVNPQDDWRAWWEQNKHCYEQP